MIHFSSPQNVLNILPRITFVNIRYSMTFWIELINKTETQLENECFTLYNTQFPFLFFLPFIFLESPRWGAESSKRNIMHFPALVIKVLWKGWDFQHNVGKGVWRVSPHMSSACTLQPAVLLVGTSAERVEDIAWHIWGNCSPVIFEDTQPVRGRAGIYYVFWYWTFR